ncbi:MAG TPA: hypothetical protein P5294_07820 [Smithellaceae bacterium]|nr:hypothetical protein [Smithellaceae bacterium]HRS89481.1 hypothetical protein [Smithellaceae bacterium]HRV26430.1 hypothetical protein [Smithellaceae bacterium]
MPSRKKPAGNLYFPDSLKSLIDQDINSGDFLCGLPAHAGDKECRHLFLNIYDEEKIRKRFEQIGLISYLHDKGYTKIKISADKEGSFTSRLSVYDATSAPENIIIDTRFSETVFTPHAEFCAVVNEKREACSFNLIVIEWLETINPRAQFTAERPQLPGQKKPGLGVLSYIKNFLPLLGADAARDGFLKVADHVHNAIIYADIFMFVNPARQGYLNAMRRDLEKFTLSEIAWGFLTETIYDAKTGTPEKYIPSEQVLPLADRLMEIFTSRKYAEGVKAVYDKKSFLFDFERMNLLKEDWLKTNKLEDA